MFIVRFFQALGLIARGFVQMLSAPGLYLMLGARNLVQARRRTLLLGGVLGFVTLLFVVFSSLIEGATQSMTRAALTLSTGHVNVAGFYKMRITEAAPVVLHADELKKVIEETIPDELDYVLFRERGFAKIVSDTGSQLGGLAGIRPEEEQRLLQTLVLAKESDYKEKGGDARKGDLTKVGQPGTITIFANQAKKLQVSVGDRLTVMNPTLHGTQNSADLLVVAICEDIGLLSSWNTFVARQTILDLYQLKADSTGALQVYLKDIRHSDKVADKLRKAYAAKGYKMMDPEANPFFMKFQGVNAEDWTGQKLDVTTWSDEISFLTKIIFGIKAFGVFVLTILLVIIVVGIINAMWIAVRERTGEIGTLRAVGMEKERVLAMFVAEAGLLGVGAAGVGALVGALVAALVNAAHIKITVSALRFILMSDRFNLTVTPSLVTVALVLFTVVAVISALWPALRAANLQPVTAIQQTN